jgi:nucleotide-binding universal stress UspA family protein
MSTIDLVHVMSPDASWPRLGASCEQAHSPVREAVERRTEMQRAFEQADGPDVSVACNILFGRPGRAIVSYIAAQQARLVLMTPGPAKGMRTAVLGGITDHVLRHARCPVLALPGVYENAARIVKDEPAGPGTLDRRHRSA